MAKKEDKTIKTYTYKFIEMRDEMEKTVSTIEKAMVQNASIQADLIESKLNEKENFKLIIKNLQDQYKNYDEQLTALKRRIEIGNKYLENITPEVDSKVVLLMDFLGVFRK